MATLLEAFIRSQLDRRLAFVRTGYPPVIGKVKKMEGGWVSIVSDDGHEAVLCLTDVFYAQVAPAGVAIARAVTAALDGKAARG